MGALLQDVIKAAIAHNKREADFNAAWDVVWTLGNQISAAQEYIAIGSWHDMPGLGEALRRAFRLALIPESVDDLNFRVSEGLKALFFAVHDILVRFEADPAATWEGDALPRLNALHGWAVTVWLGTSDLLHPGINVDDFRWDLP